MLRLLGRMPAISLTQRVMNGAPSRGFRDACQSQRAAVGVRILQARSASGRTSRSERPNWVQAAGLRVSSTTILPTFLPAKRPMNAGTACSMPDTTVSSFFSFPALK